MRVITVSDEQFAAMCRQLGEAANREFGAPDVILGIKNGGGHVADRIAPLFPGATVIYATARRPTSATKGRIRSLLRHLPTGILDTLRILESKWLSHSDDDRRQVELESPIPPGSKVLVTDDAVDTGHTLQAVLNLLKQSAPEATIVTAAITVTTGTPAVTPDCALYRDGTLIRFPWSYDAK